MWKEFGSVVLSFGPIWFLVGVGLGYLLPRWERNGRGGRRSGTSGAVELYVGNLSYDVSEKDLEKAFDRYGAVASVRIIKNRFSGRSKGFGFVEMAREDESMAAIQALNGKDLKGRRIVVNEAKSQARGN